MHAADRDTEALRARIVALEEHLRLAVSAGRLGDWEWEVATGRVRWSAALERLHGIPEGSFEGTFEAYQRDIHPDDRQRVLDNVRQTLERRDPGYEIRYRILPPGGGVRWLHARGRLLFGADGEVERLIGVCEDVTDTVTVDEERVRLLQVFEEAPLSITVLRGPEHRLEYVNAHARARGSSPEHVGKTAAEILPKAQNAAVLLFLDQVYRTGKTIRIPDLELREAPGARVRTFDVCYQALRGRNGAVEGVVTFSYEITEPVESRRRAEALTRELEISEHRYRQILDSIPDMVFVKNNQLGYVWANAATCRYYGRTVDQLRGLGAPSSGERGFAEATVADDRHVVTTGQPIERPREPHVAPDGRVRLFHTVKGPIRDTSGRVVQLVGVSRDVTDLAQQEDALRVARSARLRADVAEAVAARGERAEILARVAAAFAHNLEGAAVAVMVPGPGGEVRTFAPEGAPVPAPEPSRRALAEALERGREATLVEEGTTFLAAPFGGSADRGAVVVADRPLEGTSVIVAAAALVGEAMGRHEAEEHLAARAEELARSNRDLEHFAYVASHDLQEPLRVVASYVQLLARRYRGKLDADADEFIGYAVDGATRMQALINDLLAYSRVGRKREPKPCDLKVIAARALTLLGRAIEESGATVVVGPLPVIAGTESELGQLFQNLIGNAIKFRSPDRPARVEVNATIRGRDLELTFADNGIGIAPEYHERVFVLFQRLHPVEVHPGTGIGLALCKKIVEGHGGTIRLDSSPGRGTTVIVTLPRCVAPAPAGA